MIHFDEAHRAVYYPYDRRFRIWIRQPILILLLILALGPCALAWVQNAVFGLPHIALPAAFHEGVATGPHGFPFWIRWTHFFNLFFLFMLIRSGLSILMEHPRLYFNEHCTPGTEWIRFTPLLVPTDRIWTAKDDGRYISPMVATPGYRHTVGVARSWHFITVYGFVLTGVFFVIGLFATDQWRRLVPRPDIFVPAWNTFVYYANLRIPPEPNGFYGYNALQQLSYFATIFMMAPLSILTGMAMSPALVNRFPFYARLFGGRQSARSIHFVVFIGFIGFTVVHVALVALTGFTRNMNHIVLGIDDLRPAGMIVGLIGIALVVLSWIIAHYVSWYFPRKLQHAQKAVTQPAKLLTLDQLLPNQHYRPNQISPRLWPNGKVPERDDWKELAAASFRDYKLKVSGLVENPAELSLADLRALGEEEFITMHHCIQGWTGIAKWGGLSMKHLIDHVKPKPSAKVIAFYSFGPSLFSPGYYETQTLGNALKPECMLALEMNGHPLPLVHGAPLRLRVENQLGYKMIKWIERIEFVESEKQLGKGEGGSNEDDEYFDLLPNI